MTDDNEHVTPTPEPEPTKEPEVAGLTDDQVDAKIRKLKDELSELHAGDKAEREELKAEIAALREFHAEQKAKADKENESADSKTTIVLPPSDIPPQQPNAGTQTPTEVAGKKQPWWKKAW